MYLYELIKDVDVIDVAGSDINISHMTYSTSDIQKDSLFFCIEGTKIDGHSLIQKAVDLGAAVIVASKRMDTAGRTRVIVNDTKEAMALMASRFYGNPSRKMDMIGITGTNGKTTTTFMLRSILERCGIRSGLLGTVYNTTGIRTENATRTTMESLDLHKELAAMRWDGDEACIMEVSSHSLALKRVFGVYFRIGVFTNLTQDHLDFHETMEKYFEAKLKLFDNTACSVINIDDVYGRRILERISNKPLCYGITRAQDCDVFADQISIDQNGSYFNLHYKNESVPIKLNLPGKFNIYNALAAGTAALEVGANLENIRLGLQSLDAVPGRSERIKSNKGFSIIIDYAHTPDGIYNILTTAREYTKGRLIILFGCGGDRDRTKRPLMGSMAGKLADFCIVTSDNPRSEEPDEIINDIMPGVLQTGCPYERIADRRTAISHALHIARENDVVVIAGKGHETYQELKDTTIHFDERIIVRELLKEDET